MGQILLSYIANTSRTHARAHTPTTVAVRCIGVPNQAIMVGRTAFYAGETMAGRWSIELNNMRATLLLTIGLGFFPRIKQILGRTETRTRDRICFQTIRSV